MTAGKLERLLPLACVIAAAVLFASELMTMFEFTPPGAEPLSTQSAADRHGNAMFVISAFAIASTFFAVWAGSRPAALGVATMGVIALLVFLIVDLPDAGQVGTLDDVRQSFIDAEAVPQAGFWLEMLGAIGLAVSGGALATMTPEQLMSLRGNLFRAGTPREEAASEGGQAGEALQVRPGFGLPCNHNSGFDRNVGPFGIEWCFRLAEQAQSASGSQSHPPRVPFEGGRITQALLRERGPKR